MGCHSARLALNSFFAPQGRSIVGDYKPQDLEVKWQQRWNQQRVFESEANPSKPKYYVLEMLPYPSGTLHMGHMRNYTIGDVVARVKRMQGYNVLHPMGWDAFGLPAENAAIKNQTHPRVWTNDNIAEFQRVLRRFGFSYDWRREISTCEPEYYRWNQWFFLRMLERGLAYRKKSRVNWCPKCCTVLANEQVVNGGYCWRHEDTLVEAREIEQWFLKTTAYAEQLLDDLKLLEGSWPERVITMQRNWIGKSIGAKVWFTVADFPGQKIEIFTTRIDTIYGSSALILAPNHPLAESLIAGADPAAHSQRAAKLALMKQSSVKMEDVATAEKDGFFTGRYAVNPFNNEKIPIWVGNFVLMEYGTGAIMAVPAHDERDFEFATKFGLPIPVVVEPPNDPNPQSPPQAAFTDYGVSVNSGPYSGLASADAIEKMAADADAAGFGKKETIFRLRDWGVSRQRFWGTPIPIIYCPNDGMVPVPDKDLPVVLPANPKLTGEGQSPLARPRFRQRQVSQVRRSRSPRNRHHGHLRRFLLVFLSLLRSAQRPGSLCQIQSRLLVSHRPVHRRHRTCHSPPHVLALLVQSHARHRPDFSPRARRSALHPRHGSQGWHRHVQIRRQRGRRPRYGRPLWR